ncbi:MAG: type 4a pilus biogenesis protein PilO [Rubrivivax sp.]|nr:type 4a pilus biogenesis protein PilO [Rubrivivax sp.]MBK7263859.1 type 4a pilus biogenesis protein PilO [Rubrivivax sp.]MBK8525861.1 type 4a pilus biogenesis protein PilO [Rubrivivax sp.]
MATNTPSTGFDATGMWDQAVSQFRGLNPSEPGQWPWMPKVAVFTAVVVGVVAIGWFALLSSSVDELQAERDREPALKQQFESKLAQAVNLGELRKQKLQVQEYVTQLEKQLPGKAEMDALLSDINQAGLGRGLAFDLFKPGQVEVKDFYAELPITIRVQGRYHDIGSFAADVANLSRIVTLHNLAIGPLNVRDNRDGSGQLSMEAVARTYRYLDANEVAEQKKAAAAKAAGAKK